jgi:hypothetical protein
MRRGTAVLTGIALALALAVPSSAQERSLPTETTTIDGTIETIDHNTRAMNIKTSDGTVAVTAPKSVERFGELKVGDHVKATYNNNVHVRLKPADEAAVDTIETEYVKAGAAAGTKSVVRRMTADVVALDPVASSISFKAPNGWSYSRRVVDPAVFDQVKVGDKVDIIWNTDLTVELVQ